MRIGINGFGRMGRLALRAAWSRDDLEVVAVNEPNGTAETMALLLEFDSVQGRWDRTCVAAGDSIDVSGKGIAYSRHRSPAEIPFGLGADRHGGVVHDELRLGIVRGSVTTIHAPTNSQSVVDAPHEDPRRARASMLNLLPTSTNSATAVTLIVPELAGKLDSVAIRSPVMNASMVDAVFQVERDTTVVEVNALLEAASRSERLRGILGYEERPLVSADHARDPRSGVVDALSTR